MTCPNCSSDVPNDDAFCGKCGFKVKVGKGDLDRRLALIEKEYSSRDQRLLELETVEHVMDRIQSRVTRFSFFAGIPLSIAMIALLVIFGKGAYTLEDIASKARNSIEPLVTETKTRAEDTKSTVAQMQQQLKPAQEEIVHLRGQTAIAMGDVKQLDARLKISQLDIDALTARVNSENQRVTQLSQQLKNVETQKNVTKVRDPKAKKPGATWVVLSVSSTIPTDRITAAKVAELQQSLESSGFIVFSGWVSLYKSTGRTSTGTGPSFNEASCLELANIHPPCILYLREDLRDKAEQAQQLVNGTRTIPSDRLIFPKLPGAIPQLIEKSAIDLVIVL
jgi:polyhydroxyalkanoate synthesis regulator phasin